MCNHNSLDCLFAEHFWIHLCATIKSKKLNYTVHTTVTSKLNISWHSRYFHLASNGYLLAPIMNSQPNNNDSQNLAKLNVMCIGTSSTKILLAMVYPFIILLPIHIFRKYKHTLLGP